MKVLLVGGGTGGHLMPLLPLAAELKARNHHNKVFAVTDKTTPFASVLQGSVNIDEVYKVSAGKLRRYSNQPISQTILDVKTHALNTRDATRTLKGLGEAYRLLKRVRPDVIFIKGGYVAVPVGIAAHRCGIPFVVHDSDAVPSLVTRIIGRWAEQRLAGTKSLSSDQELSGVVHVGIPMPGILKPVSLSQQKVLKKRLGLPANKPLLLVTGGSQGARIVNEIVDQNRQPIADADIFTVHVTGDSRESQKTDMYQSLPFANNFHDYIRAADVVVTRAGSVMAEFAAVKKPIIVVPADHLAGGHQNANAQIVKDANAAVVLSEQTLQKTPLLLSDTIKTLIGDKTQREKMETNLQRVYPSYASKKIVDILQKYLPKEGQ